MNAERDATPHPDFVATETMDNRFLLCAIAFHRTRQLKDGAAPRIHGDAHKAPYLAVLEVLADTVSWSRA